MLRPNSCHDPIVSAANAAADELFDQKFSTRRIVFSSEPVTAAPPQPTPAETARHAASTIATQRSIAARVMAWFKGRVARLGTALWSFMG